MAPKNRYELSAMMDFAVNQDGPVALKYPRGNAYYGMKEFHAPLEIGKSEFSEFVTDLPENEGVSNGYVIDGTETLDDKVVHTVAGVVTLRTCTKA